VKQTNETGTSLASQIRRPLDTLVREIMDMQRQIRSCRAVPKIPLLMKLEALETRARHIEAIVDAQHRSEGASE
jgi:hypothetical protein